jgi:predicted DNA-binding protein (MmcQ/YjbR family)
MTYASIREKVAELDGVSVRAMFGYECFSIGSKFFVGFSKKNSSQVIVKLPVQDQQKALKTKGIRPFSHGAKAGWIEINTNESSSQSTLKWIMSGYTNAKKLSK